MRNLHPPVNSADNQAFFAPVELERFTQLEFERNEGFIRCRLSRIGDPFAHDFGRPTEAAGKSIRAYLLPELLRRAPITFRAVSIRFERLGKSCQKRRKFLLRVQALIFRFNATWRA